MPDTWDRLIPRIATRLVGTVWTRSALEELLTPFETSIDIFALTVSLLDARPMAPFREDTARRVVVDIGFPGPPYVPPIVVTPPPTDAYPWRFDVPRLSTVADLASALNVTVAELEWFADLGGRLRTSARPLRHYRAHEIAKHRGVRILEVPKPRLREMQRTIVRTVLDCVPPHDAAHGFCRGRSAVTFARPHDGSDVVVRVDLADFFTGITRPRVQAVFGACGYPRAVAALLSGICTTAMPVDETAQLPRPRAVALRTPHLPQGAPTSPALANLVARGLDRRVAGYVRTRGITYTRYADDLAFSGPSTTDVARLLGAIGHIAVDEGFTVNRSKTLVRRAHRRQSLAGLVVNTRAAAPREKYDALRALLHNCAITGAAAQNRDRRPDFRAHVYGLIAWIGESHEGRRARLRTLADAVDWES